MKLEALVNKARLTSMNLTAALSAWDDCPAALKRKVRAQIKSADIGRGAAAAEVVRLFVQAEPQSVGLLPVAELTQDVQVALLKNRKIDVAARLKLVSRLSNADDVAVAAVASFLKSNDVEVAARVLKRLAAIAEERGDTRALRILNAMGGAAPTRTPRAAADKAPKTDTRRGAGTARTAGTRTPRAADKTEKANTKSVAALVEKVDAASVGTAADVKAVRMAVVDALSTTAKVKEYAQVSGAALADVRKAKRMLAEASAVSAVRAALKLLCSQEPAEADAEEEELTVDSLLAETRTPARRRVAKSLIAQGGLDAKTKRLVNAIATASGAKAGREAFAALQAHCGVEVEAKPVRGRKVATQRVSKADQADVDALAGVVAELLSVCGDTDFAQARKEVRELTAQFEDALVAVHPAPKGVLLKSIKAVREALDYVASATKTSQVRDGLAKLEEALSSFVAQDTKHVGAPRLVPAADIESLDDDADLDDELEDELDDESEETADMSAFIQLGDDLNAVRGDAAAQRKLAREFVSDDNEAGEYAEVVKALAESKSKSEIAQLADEVVEAAEEVSSAKKSEGDTDLDDGDSDLADADLDDSEDSDLDDSDLDETSIDEVTSAAQAIADAEPKIALKLAREFVKNYEDADSEIFDTVNEIASCSSAAEIRKLCEDLGNTLSGDAEELSDVDEEIDFYAELDNLIESGDDSKAVRVAARKLIKFVNENEDPEFQPDADVMDCLSIIAESGTSKDVQAGLALLADAVQTLVVDEESLDDEDLDDEDELDGIKRAPTPESRGIRKSRSLSEAQSDLLEGDDDDDFTDEDLGAGTTAITGRRRPV